MKQNNPIIIKAGKLWNGRSPVVDTDITMVIQNGRIESMGPSGSFPQDTSYTYDWSGYTVLPGLIDAHTHLSMDPTLDNYLERLYDSPEVLADRSRSMMKKDLEAGVTTCRCLGDREFVDVACKAEIAEKAISGPELLIAVRGIKKSQSPGFVGYPVSGIKQIQQVIDDNVARGADLTKIYITGTYKKDQDIKSYLSYEEIRAAIDHSHKMGIRVATHCVGGTGYDWAIELGIDTIEHLYHVTDRQIEMLAAGNTYAVMTPGAVMTTTRVDNLPAEIIPLHYQEKDMIVERMSAVIKSGIPLALGTDGMHGDMATEISYLVEMGASTVDALSAATFFGACACGISEETGSLETGKRADLIIVEGDPMTDLDALSRITGVIKNGELVYKKNTGDG